MGILLRRPDLDHGAGGWTRSLAAVALALGLSGAAGAAWSQDAASGQLVAQAADQSAQTNDQTAQNGQTSAVPAAGQLQEVVVTAERRTQNIQTTPISIVATSGAQLAQQNVITLQNLDLYTPSLSFNNDGLYQSPSIRGLGTAFSPSLPLGVALLEDNLFIAEQHGFGDPFYDIQDVETLRGPQGTFIGYNSTAGAIEVTSVNPNFRGTNGYAEAQFGNYSDKRFDGAVNFVLDPDVLAVRFAGNVEQMGSFYRDIGALVNPANNQPVQDPGQTDNKDFRASGLWKPTNSLQFLLKLQYTSSEDGGDPSELNPTPFSLPKGAKTCPNGSPGPICHTNFLSNASTLPFVLDWTPQNGVLAALGHPYYNWRNGLKLDYTFNNGTDLRSVTGFEQTQYNTLAPGCGCNLPNSGAFYQWIPRDDYYSEEVDLISPTTGPVWSKLNYVAGASWFYRDTGVTVNGTTSSPPYSLAAPFMIKINNDTIYRIMGVFGQVSWQMLPTLQLQVGARENWDNAVLRGTVDQVEIPGILPATVPSIGCFESPAPKTGYLCITPNMRAPFEDSVPTGKIDLNWTPVQGQFFYAFYARGYKGGIGIAEGTAMAPRPPQAVLPEHVNDYEIGWNGTMLAGHLRTHLGGYWTVDQNAQQAGLFFPLTGGTNALGNLGSETLKGIEASLDGRFAGLGVNFSGGYEKATVTGITNVASYALPPSAAGKGQCGYPGVAAPPACFDYAGIFPGDANYYVPISGETGTYAPIFQGSVGVDYLFNIGKGTLDPSLTYSYTAKQYASLFEIPYYTLGARRIWNAALTYDVNQWQVEAYDTNFTNQVYFSGIMGTSVFYGNPMQVGVRVRRDF